MPICIISQFLARRRARTECIPSPFLGLLPLSGCCRLSLASPLSGNRTGSWRLCISQANVHLVSYFAVVFVFSVVPFFSRQASLRELTPVFLNLVSDSSKIVRTVALENLGRLISTLPGESVSEELVRYFTGTAVESMGDPSVSEPSILPSPPPHASPLVPTSPRP